MLLALQRKIPKQVMAGVTYKLLACLCFALINVAIRSFGKNEGQGGMSSAQIAFLQYSFGLMCMAPTLRKNSLRNLKTSFLKLHLVRVLSAGFGISFWYVALFYMDVTTALALGITNPIFTIIGAKIYLKEIISKNRMVAIILSFMGVMIITKPYESFFAMGENGFNATYLFPLLSAALFAVTKLCSRQLAKSGEKPGAMTLYLLIFVVPFLFVPAYFSWKTPTKEQIVLSFFLGILATLAQIFTLKALEHLDLSLLNPIGFAKIIFSAFLAFILFNEFPTNFSWWIGALFIMFSLITLLREKVDIAL